MGLVYADIELMNGGDFLRFREGLLPEPDIRRMTVRMNADSGALMLAINDTIKEQLGLPVLEVRNAQLTDGNVVQLEVVGPVEVRFENRQCTTRAFVLPGNTQPLLGAIPMEDMDVLIDPARRQLIVNPEHPIVAQMELR